MKNTPAARAYALAFGAAAAHLRGSRGQAEIARSAGLSQSALSRIEAGTALPDAYATGKLAEALGSSSGELARVIEEVLRRAPAVASAVYRREVTPPELPGLPAVDGLFRFLAGVVTREP